MKKLLLFAMAAALVVPAMAAETIYSNAEHQSVTSFV